MFSNYRDKNIRIIIKKKIKKNKIFIRNRHIFKPKKNVKFKQTDELEITKYYQIDYWRCLCYVQHMMSLSYIILTIHGFELHGNPREPKKTLSQTHWEAKAGHLAVGASSLSSNFCIVYNPTRGYNCVCYMIFIYI